MVMPVTGNAITSSFQQGKYIDLRKLIGAGNEPPKVNTQMNISQLHRVLIIRSTLLNNAEARDAVFAFITESVAALEELRQLVQPDMA